MSRTLRSLGVAAALALTGGLLAAGTAVAADPDLTAPTTAVGDCHALTMADGDLASLTSAAVDCATTHTSLTIAVGTLPATLTFDGDKNKIFAAVGATCGTAFTKKIGSNLLYFARSQYTWLWFQPTDEQIAAGARWFSCHLVVTEDNKFGALPNPAPKLSNKMPNAIATCSTSRLVSTTCADTHSWRATYTAYVKGKATTANVKKAAKATCPKHVASKKNYVYNDFVVSSSKFILICSTKTTH